MRYLHLVWRNLLRKKFRTVFTLLSVLVAFVLFGYLAAINNGFGYGVELTGADRLLVIHKVSLIQPLPQSYEARIDEMSGIVDATAGTWFGGIYQDPKNFFAQIAVDPEPWLRMYPEYRLPDDEKQAWLADRTAAIAGRVLAERHGWKVGDRIPIQGTIWRPKEGGSTWEFNLVGIYDGAEKGTDTTQFFFRYDYLDEMRSFGEGLVGWYVIRVADSSEAAQIAQRIDSAFANSPYETKTSTEKAFMQSFAKQVGDIGAIIRFIVAAVFFTLFLVAGNTMAQAVRERTAELAVLKSIGFADAHVLALVLAEAFVLVGTGGGLGLALGWWLVSMGDPTRGAFPAFYIPARDIVIGVGLVALLAMASGAVPAIRAMRLRIVDALRRV